MLIISVKKRNDSNIIRKCRLISDCSFQITYCQQVYIYINQMLKKLASSGKLIRV